MTEPDRPRPSRPRTVRSAWLGMAAAALALSAVAGGVARTAAQDNTVGIKPWLPSKSPPQSQTLERQRTGVYRDRLKAETRRFELRGDATDPRALDRNRSFQSELDRLRRVAPPGITPPGSR